MTELMTEADEKGTSEQWYIIRIVMVAGEIKS